MNNYQFGHLFRMEAFVHGFCTNKGYLSNSNIRSSIPKECSEEIFYQFVKRKKNRTKPTLSFEVRFNKTHFARSGYSSSWTSMTWSCLKFRLCKSQECRGQSLDQLLKRRIYPWSLSITFYHLASTKMTLQFCMKIRRTGWGLVQDSWQFFLRNF